MGRLDTELTRQFYAWEARGRGHRVFPYPVALEPPFQPFTGYMPPSPSAIDDGRKPTILSTLVDSALNAFSSKSEEALDDGKSADLEPELLERDGLIELQVILPADGKVLLETFSRFLGGLVYCVEPITLELLGTSQKVVVQFVVHTQDADLVRRQLKAHFPETIILPCIDNLEEAWNAADDSDMAIVEFGLGREFMLPLAADSGDLLVGIVAAFSELQPGEVGLYQVIFQPAKYPWGDSIVRSVADIEGRPLFVNRPELLPASEKKVSQALYTAVVRLAARGNTFDRAWEVVREAAAPLGLLSQPGGNELIPLRNDHYPPAEHSEDVVRRQCRRTGMLLNAKELVALAHLPSSAVRTPKLVRETGDSKALPGIFQKKSGLLLGHNIHAGQIEEVRLSQEQRIRHTHIIGASGTGKSTLLFNMIRQDLSNGEGLAVLDPHGDLIEQILEAVPAHRIDDVVLLDPSDEEYAIGFNILSAHSDLEKTLLASDLTSVFQRLSSSWGDQMHSVLNNAIRTFLESSQGGTLSDLRRFLLDTGFRERFLQTVSDPEVVYYWKKGFPQLGGNKSVGPLITRLDTFLGPRPIRHMVSQPVNRLDFADIMDSGKIFLAKLSQGQIGKENAYLLGSLLMSKFQQQAMSRQSKGKSDRRPFWLYVDECHNFITPSMAEILTDVRKYHLGLVLSHQEVRQLRQDDDVASAIMSNTCTRVVFRVGDADARTLSEGFSSFKPEHLRNLSVGTAICRIERGDHDFNLSVPLTQDGPSDGQEADVRERVVAASREKYATLRSEVEENLRKSFAEASPASVAAVPPESPKETSPPLQAEIQTSRPTKPKAEPKPAGPPSDMGRGGAQHQAIQQRLKAEAEKQGYRVILEKPVLDGKGSVDLVLEKADVSLACEINVTSTIDYEVGNVVKCIKAGFKVIFVICPRSERLIQLTDAVRGCLQPDDAAKVSFVSPDEFIAHLQKVDLQQTPLPKPSPGEERKKGYKVKTKYVDLSAEEIKAKEEEAIKLVAEKMKRNKKS